MIQTNSDGGARGNPGPGAIGVVLRKDNEIIKKCSEKVGIITNNIAEYKALIKALELARTIDKEIICYLDSELVIRQLQGRYKVKNKELKKLFDKTKLLEESFDKIVYKHVSRWDKFQQLADELVNEELDKK